MLNIRKALSILLLSAYCSISYSQAPDLTKYVQPISGTDAATTPSALKNGTGNTLFANTIPAVTMPFGMTQWTPQTQNTENKCVPPYFYKDDTFRGFRGSHWLSGSCTQDYGSVTIMPVTGNLKVQNTGIRFSHNDEVATPYSYKINLQAYRLQAAITATARCGMMQFTIDKTDSLYLLIMPNSDFGEGYIKIDKQHNEIYGYNPVHRIYQGWGKKAGFNGYFVIRFERSAGNTGTFSEDRTFTTDSIQNKKDLGAFVGFKMHRGEKLTIRIGTSFSSIDGARKNLQAEMPGYNFDAVVAKGKAIWQKALEQITVNTAHKTDKDIFYTSFYHAMQQPRLFNDVDGTYPKFATDYQLAKLPDGDYYDDFSMWDIYRAELPLFEILRPKLINNIVRSLILKAQQGGWMPIFPCWNSYTSEMIGDHATSVISSAYLKGIRNYDAAEAYRVLRQNAFELPASKSDYVQGKGRRALNAYLKYGYIPLEDSVLDAYHKREQVSRTMEYAYDDYALAQLSKSLGKTADYEQLIKRAGNYANVFDKRVGLVRGRLADGSWATPFNPDGKETYITEGTPRQYTFYVPQNVPGLAKLMGGAAKLESALDTLFAKNEYWHGNEPGHQIPFMYNFTPSPWKTQQHVRQILAQEYSNGPGGLGGNDDAGQMSAWYIFGSIGFYPVNPISGEYILCSPLFDNIKLKLPNGKTMEIVSHKTTATAQYIHLVKWNGKVYAPNYIRYANLMQGGKIEFYLQSQPDKKWGSNVKDQPTGMTGSFN
jgi:predicted alpha-1,2-mannosidase